MAYVDEEVGENGHWWTSRRLWMLVDKWVRGDFALRCIGGRVGEGERWWTGGRVGEGGSW